MSKPINFSSPTGACKETLDIKLTPTDVLENSPERLESKHHIVFTDKNTKDIGGTNLGIKKALTFEK